MINYELWYTSSNNKRSILFFTFTRAARCVPGPASDRSVPRRRRYIEPGNRLRRRRKGKATLTAHTSRTGCTGGPIVVPSRPSAECYRSPGTTSVGQYDPVAARGLIFAGLQPRTSWIRADWAVRLKAFGFLLKSEYTLPFYCTNHFGNDLKFGDSQHTIPPNEWSFIFLHTFYQYFYPVNFFNV